MRFDGVHVSATDQIDEVPKDGKVKGAKERGVGDDERTDGENDREMNRKN